MGTKNLLAVTTACVTLVGRRSNATWSARPTAKSTTTSASAMVNGGACYATYQAALVSYSHNDYRNKMTRD